MSTHDRSVRERRLLGLAVIVRGLPELRSAACAAHPEPLWDDTLDDEIEPADDRSVRHRRASEICAGCVDRVACFDAAHRRRVPGLSGIWGGALVRWGAVDRACETCGEEFTTTRRERLCRPCLNHADAERRRARRAGRQTELVESSR